MPNKEKEFFVYMKRIIRKTYINDSNVQKDLLETFQPRVHESNDYKNWIAILDLKTCLQCRLNMVKYICKMK